MPLSQQGKPVTMLSPLTTQPRNQYTGRGNLDVPMKSHKPENHSKASWVFEPSPFAFATSVKDELGRNKHVVTFLSWADRVSKWLIYESLLDPKFTAAWKATILKKHKLEQVKAWKLADLEANCQEYLHCFLERKENAAPTDPDRLLITAPCMKLRRFPGMGLPHDSEKPAEIEALENEFRKDGLPTHYYNRLPIYRQGSVRKWYHLTWKESAQIPNDLVQACEFGIYLTDSTKGYAKMHFDLKSVYLTGWSPIPPPMFGRQQEFEAEVSDEDECTKFYKEKEAEQLKRKQVSEEKEEHKKEGEEEPSMKRVSSEETKNGSSSDGNGKKARFSIPTVNSDEEDNTELAVEFTS